MRRRRWRTAARELRKAVEVDHVYAEEVMAEHPPVAELDIGAHIASA